MMDANESYEDIRQTLHKILADTGLEDLMGEKHVNASTEACMIGYATIDFIWESPLFQAALSNYKMLAYHDEIISNHKHHFFDFNTNLLLGIQDNNYTNKKHRKLCLGNLTIMANYHELFTKFLIDHNVHKHFLAL